jgi:hypothetical protein
MSTETMINPFTGVRCDVTHLKPGDVVEAGDIYRSTTVTETRSDMGRWYHASDLLVGTTIGELCNVHFIRLSPIVESVAENEQVGT